MRYRTSQAHAALALLEDGPELGPGPGPGSGPDPGSAKARQYDLAAV